MIQVVAIHGGDAFATYEEYISFLKNVEIDLAHPEGRGWKANLQIALGSDYEVILPRMPNATNAKYLEWKLWFGKYLPLLQNELILVGHSFGGSFLAKYLSEERVSKKILATFLVAAPYDRDGERKVVEFTLPESLALLENQGGEIYLYHSEDDPVVPFTELSKYQKALPAAHARMFADRQHFNQEAFPELVQDIQQLR